MHRSLAQFSEPGSFVRTRFLAGFIITTFGFRFSVHTTQRIRQRVTMLRRLTTGEVRLTFFAESPDRLLMIGREIGDSLIGDA